MLGTHHDFQNFFLLDVSVFAVTDRWSSELTSNSFNSHIRRNCENWPNSVEIFSKFDTIQRIRERQQNKYKFNEWVNYLYVIRISNYGMLSFKLHEPCFPSRRDGIPAFVLKMCSSKLAPILTLLFQVS